MYMSGVKYWQKAVYLCVRISESWILGGSLMSISLRYLNQRRSCHCCVTFCNTTHPTIARATCVIPYWFFGRLSSPACCDHSRRTRSMNEAKENAASLLPGKMTLNALIEECAANKEVVVIYSLIWIGARVNCSANVRTVETARPKIGRVTGPPPNNVRSTSVVVTPTATVARLLATEN